MLNEQSWFQPWRFVTAIFLHGSLPHLLYNLFALLLFGLILEKLVGSKKFLYIFFISGILANVISINFYPSSLGASGAIMGVIGALAIIRPMMTVWAFGLIMPMAVAAVLWVAGDIIGVFFPSNKGNIAHLSGVLCGIVFGIIFRIKHHVKNKSSKIDISETLIDSWEKNYMD